MQIDEIPLFPISTVLLPGSELPVQIFPEKSETQAMFKGLRDGGQLGVVLADYDRLGGSFARVGCQARVADLTELDDGRLIVETAGVRRFRILAISRWRPHITAVVRYLDDAPAAAAAAADGERPGATPGGGDPAGDEDVDAMEQECWQALQVLHPPPLPSSSTKGSEPFSVAPFLDVLGRSMPTVPVPPGGPCRSGGRKHARARARARPHARMHARFPPPKPPPPPPTPPPHILCDTHIHRSAGAAARPERNRTVPLPPALRRPAESSRRPAAPPPRRCPPSGLRMAAAGVRLQINGSGP